MKFIIGLLLYTSQLFAGTETIVKASIVEGQATKKNYVANSHFEKNTVGYTTYKDAAATRPADGTGGSPTQLTISRTTSSPLAGEGSLLLTKAAANAQGEGVGIPFTIDSADKAKLLQIDFDYAVDSGTFAAGSSSADSDLIVYLFDVTNGALIEPVNFRLNASSSLSYKQSASFQASATSTSYRLIFHVATTSASAWALKIDNISVSPLVTSAGGAVSTAKLSGSTSTINNSGHSLITFTTVDIDNVGAVSSNNTVTIKESGNYSIYADFKVSVTGGGGSGQNISAYVYKNGASVAAGTTPSISAGTHVYNPQISSTFKLNAGDTIQLKGDEQAVAGTMAVSDATLIVSKIADASAIGAGSVISTVVQNTAGTSIANAAWTGVPFATTVQDTVSAFSTPTYTAKVSGTYQVKLVTVWAANTTGQRGQRIRKNGADTGIGSFMDATAALTLGQSSSGDVALNAGDTITVEVYQNSGGALALSTATDVSNLLSISKLASDSAVNALNALKIPTVQRFASGSGTYTAPAGVRYIKVKMVGGGGSPTVAGVGSGNAGASSTFGSSLLTAGGGAGSTGPGGAVGGTTTVNSPAINILSVTGGDGCVGGALGANGGNGGASALGGAGAGSHNGSSSATAGYDGTGGGGGGNGYASQAGSGGGGAGGYIEAIISSPTSYAYSVGAGGAAVAGGVKGGDGLITVEEYY